MNKGEESKEKKTQRTQERRPVSREERMRRKTGKTEEKAEDTDRDDVRSAGDPYPDHRGDRGAGASFYREQ